MQRWPVGRKSRVITRVIVHLKFQAGGVRFRDSRGVRLFILRVKPSVLCLQRPRFPSDFQPVLSAALSQASFCACCARSLQNGRAETHSSPLQNPASLWFHACAAVRVRLASLHSLRPEDYIWPLLKKRSREHRVLVFASFPPKNLPQSYDKRRRQTLRVRTAVSLEAGRWGARRVLLDAVQNHNSIRSACRYLPLFKTKSELKSLCKQALHHEVELIFHRIVFRAALLHHTDSSTPIAEVESGELPLLRA